MKYFKYNILLILFITIGCSDDDIKPSQNISEEYTQVWAEFVGYASFNRVDVHAYPVTVVSSSENYVKRDRMEIGLCDCETLLSTQLHLLARGVGKLQGMNQNDNMIMESEIPVRRGLLIEAFEEYFAHKSFDKYQVDN